MKSKQKNNTHFYECFIFILYNRSGSCNGIALWVDWKLNGDDDPKSTVSSGPCAKVEIGKFIDWDYHSRQGVHLLPHAHPVLPNKVLICDTTFLPDDGNIYFKFDIN